MTVDRLWMARMPLCGAPFRGPPGATDHDPNIGNASHAGGGAEEIRSQMPDLPPKSVELPINFSLLGSGPPIGVARGARGGTDGGSRFNSRPRPVRLPPPEPDRLDG